MTGSSKQMLRILTYYYCDKFFSWQFNQLGNHPTENFREQKNAKGLASCWRQHLVPVGSAQLAILVSGIGRHKQPNRVSGGFLQQSNVCSSSTIVNIFVQIQLKQSSFPLDFSFFLCASPLHTYCVVHTFYSELIESKNTFGKKLTAVEETFLFYRRVMRVGSYQPLRQPLKKVFWLILM